MLSAPDSDKESELVKVIADNNLKIQKCYNRQLDLILEVINRGYE